MDANFDRGTSADLGNCWIGVDKEKKRDRISGKVVFVRGVVIRKKGVGLPWLIHFLIAGVFHLHSY